MSEVLTSSCTQTQVTVSQLSVWRFDAQSSGGMVELSQYLSQNSLSSLIRCPDVSLKLVGEVLERQGSAWLTELKTSKSEALEYNSCTNKSPHYRRFADVSQRTVFRSAMSVRLICLITDSFASCKPNPCTVNDTAVEWQWGHVLQNAALDNSFEKSKWPCPSSQCSSSSGKSLAACLICR